VLEVGLVLEDATPGFCGAVLRWERGLVVLEERHGKQRSAPSRVGAYPDRLGFGRRPGRSGQDRAGQQDVCRGSARRRAGGEDLGRRSAVAPTSAPRSARSLVAAGARPVFDHQQGHTGGSPDVTTTVKFSQGLGNLKEFSYEQERPTCNWCVVAGQGQGSSRVFVVAWDAESIARWGRIEGPLVDRRDTGDLDQLRQTAIETLAKGVGTLSIETVVEDTDEMQFWRHWGLGSRVSVILDGVTYTDVVREVDVMWESADTPVRISPLIGSPQARRPEVPAMFAKQRANALRVYQLEARL
jgi:hypothetical protein